VYALVASSKAPPGGTNFSLSTSASSAANPKFDPQETTNYEVGTKWDLLGQKLSLAGALFRTEVKNEVEQDPVDRQVLPDRQEARARYRTGRDWRDLRGWLVSAGYVRQSTSVESGKIVTASGDNQLTYTPKQAFTLWSSYTLPFGLQIWRRRPLQRQAGARHRRRRRHPGLRRFVLGVRRHGVVPDQQAHRPAPERVQPGRQGIRASDQQVGLPLHPGAPRSGSLTANFKF
jgi:catecholate siderophore receptor